MKKIILLLIATFLIFGAIAFFAKGDEINFALQKLQLPEKEISVAEIQQPVAPDSSDSENKKETEFEGINLAVPFSSQAPLQDWSAPYQEACEETSALLVDRFYKGEDLTSEIAKEEILKIVDWENETFAYYEHTTAAETARILKEYFGYERVDVLYDISVEDIKKEIIAGRPVIVPLAGRMLGNPFYTAPGPIYHMLVVKGITKDGDFITNDVGTRKGNNYVYDATVFYDAIHDAPFGGGELTNVELEKDIPTGRKAIIVVYPN